jgi:hypothetical protein
VPDGTSYMPDTLLTLRYAVEKAHGCKAKCADKVTVHEKQGGRTVWYGTVHVFDLYGHESAPRAYAWTIGDEAGEVPRVVTVLHKALVTGPSEAVRAIMAQLYPEDALRNEHVKPVSPK